MAATARAAWTVMKEVQQRPEIFPELWEGHFLLGIGQLVWHLLSMTDILASLA